MPSLSLSSTKQITSCHVSILIQVHKKLGKDQCTFTWVTQGEITPWQEMKNINPISHIFSCLLIDSLEQFGWVIDTWDNFYFCHRLTDKPSTLTPAHPQMAGNHSLMGSIWTTFDSNCDCLYQLQMEHSNFLPSGTYSQKYSFAHLFIPFWSMGDCFEDSTS